MNDCFVGPRLLLEHRRRTADLQNSSGYTRLIPPAHGKPAAYQPSTYWQNPKAQIESFISFC
jgi:hypothetical protein